MFASITPSRLRSILAVAAFGLALVSQADAHGRYLRNPFNPADPTNPANSGIVGTYGGTGGGGNPIQFDRPVRDNTKNIDAGTIRFDYDTYAHRNGTQAGAAISGGFHQNAGVTLKPNYQLAWVQTVIATRTGTDGINGWNLPGTGAGEYPDASPADPRYPFTTPATVIVPFAAPTFGFQDFPSRNFGDGNQSWLAELGLVCISDNAPIVIGGQNYRDVRVIDTFLWGFELFNLPAMPPPPGIANVRPQPNPLAWSDPTASYLSTLNSFYDGSGGGDGTRPAVASSRYRFRNFDNCFMEIPEPSSVFLIIAGSVFALIRRRELVG
ncbi:MAG: PEP-CTERM sorting domain-containing protein [Phycisphaerae bacterium]